MHHNGLKTIRVPSAITLEIDKETIRVPSVFTLDEDEKHPYPRETSPKPARCWLIKENGSTIARILQHPNKDRYCSEIHIHTHVGFSLSSNEHLKEDLGKVIGQTMARWEVVRTFTQAPAIRIRPDLGPAEYTMEILSGSLRIGGFSDHEPYLLDERHTGPGTGTVEYSQIRKVAKLKQRFDLAEFTQALKNPKKWVPMMEALAKITEPPIETFWE